MAFFVERGRCCDAKVIAVLIAALASFAGPQAAARSAKLTLRAVSSRADSVSGGDVLIELVAEKKPWRAWLNGTEVTSVFQPSTTGRMLGLVGPLRLGSNVLEAQAADKTKTILRLRNHPSAGPLFSGPHQAPFVCETVANGLGSAVDADCAASARVQYYYKSNESPNSALDASAAPPGALTAGFKDYPLDGKPPSDMAKTVTSEGRTVDYVVRREVGVINRAVYDIQFLQRPDEALPTPWRRPPSGWNGRLVYEFKGGCGAGYHQGVLPDPIGKVQEPLLSMGYAIASSTQNSFENNCNDRISAETLSMVKEHFIEQFGEPVHTIGWGGSGGAMQVHLIAQNYPGLLDGIIPLASFPDVVTFIQTATDCVLLDHALQGSTQAWDLERRSAVAGFASWNHCQIFPRLNLSYVDPRQCHSAVPDGVRCDLFSNEVNVFGRDPQTHLARRPLDNVGVQYGLLAFARGAISAEQFVELNERIGGLDGDGAFVPRRMAADPESVRLAYERGLLLSGGGGLSEVPILDWRGYSDELGGADVHVRYLSFVTRARLAAATGNAANHIMMVDPPEAWFEWTRHYWGPMDRLVPLMDRWLDRIATDSGAGGLAAKVVRARPRDLSDRCTAISGKVFIEPAQYQGEGSCEQLYPAYGNPRIAAGGPLADDIVKCALKPFRAADYAQPLSEAQMQRLRVVFASGVCDYQRAGVGQHVTRKVWQRF